MAARPGARPSLPDLSPVVLGAVLLARPLAIWETLSERLILLALLAMASTLRLLAAGQGGRPLRLPPRPLGLSTLAVLLASLALLEGPGVPRAGLREAIDLAAGVLTLLLAYDAAADPAGGRRILSVLLGALAAACLVGLLQPLPLFQAPVLRALDLAEKGIPVAGLGTLGPEHIQELRDRALTPRIFGTFILPNLFGGFLVILLPVAAGAWIDLRWPLLRDPERRLPRGPLALLGAVAAAGVASLFLARSHGSWIALAASAAVFAGIAMRRLKAARETRRKVVSVLAAAGFAGVLALGLSPALRARLEGGARGTFSQRIRYWQAGLEAFSEAPVLGHGLGRFGEEYVRRRVPEGEETQRAHNAYLERAVEGGVVLLGVFLFWVLSLLRPAARGAARLDPPPAPPADPLRWQASAAAAFALVLLLATQPIVFDNVFTAGSLAGEGILQDAPRVLRAFLFAGGILLFPPLLRRALAGAGPWTRVGIVAGFAGLLVHAAGEFVAEAAEVFHPALALAAVAAAWGAPEPPPGRPGLWGRPALGFAFLGLAAAGLLTLGCLFARASEDRVDKALSALRQVRTDPFGQPILDRRTGRTIPDPDLRAFLALLDEAKAADPWDPTPSIQLANLFVNALRSGQDALRIPRPGPGQGLEAIPAAPRAREEIDLALALSPNDPGLHALLGDLEEILAERDRRRPSYAARIREARRRYEIARGFYPAHPGFAFRLAQLLRKEGNAARARAVAEETLLLDRRGRIGRLKLSPSERAACRELAGGARF